MLITLPYFAMAILSLHIGSTNSVIHIRGNSHIQECNYLLSMMVHPGSAWPQVLGMSTASGMRVSGWPLEFFLP